MTIPHLKVDTLDVSPQDITEAIHTIFPDIEHGLTYSPLSEDWDMSPLRYAFEALTRSLSQSTYVHTASQQETYIREALDEVARAPTSDFERTRTLLKGVLIQTTQAHKIVRQRHQTTIRQATVTLQALRDDNEERGLTTPENWPELTEDWVAEALEETWDILYREHLDKGGVAVS